MPKQKKALKKNTIENHSVRNVNDIPTDNSQLIHNNQLTNYNNIHPTRLFSNNLSQDNNNRRNNVIRLQVPVRISPQKQTNNINISENNNPKHKKTNEEDTRFNNDNDVKSSDDDIDTTNNSDDEDVGSNESIHNLPCNPLENNIQASIQSHCQSQHFENNDNNDMCLTTNEVKSFRKYGSLTKEEVNQLTTYTRKTFFRRCKFVNPVIIHGHMNKFFDQILVREKNLQISKTFHVMQCVKETLSSRRGYCTSQICSKLRGMLA